MPEHSAVPLPPVIQGGMGVAVSSWPLARAVAAAGQLRAAVDQHIARRGIRPHQTYAGGHSPDERQTGTQIPSADDPPSLETTIALLESQG